MRGGGGGSSLTVVVEMITAGMYGLSGLEEVMVSPKCGDAT